jgi:hypothetical protein
MTAISIKRGVRMAKSECRYCRGTGFQKIRVGEAGGRISTTHVRCSHIVGAPFGKEGERFA